MLKKNLKRLMALVTVFAMAIALISVPSASAKADEAASGTYATANTWWGGGSFLVGYAAESGTIKDMENSKGYWPEGGFPWWTAVVLDQNEDGNYVVTEIVPADGSSDKGDIELTTGRIVINYHSSADANSVAFWNSVVVGDVLSYVGLWGGTPDWATLAEGGDVATFSKYVAPAEEECTHAGLVHMDAVDAACHYNGNVEYWVCYDCETVWADEALTQITNIKNVVVPALGGEVTHVEAVEAGCNNDGNIEYWYCADCEQVWQDEALTQLTNSKNVKVAATHANVTHVDAVDAACHYNGNVEYWFCTACETVWTDEALTQISNLKNVVVPALGGEVTHVEAVEAGCNNDGNIEYWYCADCEQVWQDEALTQLTNIKNVKLGATHENVIHYAAVEPACHYNGSVEYWFCSGCEGVWTDEALTQVSNSKNVVVPALGGEVVHVEAVAPTATENGNIEYWYCEECEQVWQDEALTQLTNFKNVILPATGEVDEPELPAIEVLATATFANGYDWTAQVNQIYIFASEDATATVSGFTGQTAGTFGWFHTVVLAALGDGTYTVVSSDFATNNGAESLALGEGTVILMAHDSTSYAESFAALKALAAGDVVALDTAFADVAAAYGAVEVSLGTVVEEQGCAHEGLVHMDAVEADCHYNGNVEYWVCYDCEGVWADADLTQVTNIKNVVVPATGNEVTYFPAVEAGCHYNGSVEYWYCAKCDQVWADEALTQLTNHKNVVVPATGADVVYVEAVAPTATENGNIEYWYCEECEQVWQDEALTQLTNFKNVILPATGEVDEPELPAIEVLATATFANGYDWTAQVNQIYIFASEDTAASISTLTGQDAGTYAWFHTVVLEANGDGTYTVAAAGFGGDTGAIAATLGEGKVILMAHDSTSYADSFNALKALAVGEVVALDTAWADVAAKYAEAVEVSLGYVAEVGPEDPEQPCTHEGLVHMEAVEPGCHYTGNVEHWYCPECETVWADEDLTQITNHKSVVVPALGGEVVHVEAVAPTCFEPGNIECWICEECEQVWQDAALTQLTNIKNVVLPITHNIKHVEAKAPTATENGNVEYWYCEDCGYAWTDTLLKEVTNLKSVILPATGEVADNNDATTAPETGDSAPIVVYVVTLMVAAAAVVVALRKRFA